MNKTVEILAPAGSWDSLLAAVSAGADAIYVGGSRFGARAYAQNLSEEELLRAIDYVHLHDRRIHLTVNTLFKDSELCELYKYLAPYYERGLDAVIVQDTGAMEYIHAQFPELPIHVSTQATVTSAFGAEYFKRFGVQRIVPARELQLEEIKKIKEQSGLEMECFVHGALCYCYSGQCLMSSMIGGRSGNRGQCAQPCRLSYSVQDQKKQDFLSLKDLCTIEMLPQLLHAGIDSFKIEGRMKQPDYVYTVVSMYRKYVDLYLKYGEKSFSVSAEDRKILENAYRRRGYTKGYYRQHNGKEMLSLKRPKETGIANDFTFKTKTKEKINGKLILSYGERAKLYLEYNGMSVMCEGAMVQNAIKQPLDRARVEKQIRKTGETEFEFAKLDVLMGSDVFLPMQALNELRRDAVSKLEEKVLERYQRSLRYDVDNLISEKEPKEKKIRQERMELSALVSDEIHLRRVLGDDRIDTVYVDASIAFSEAERKVMLEKTPERETEDGRYTQKVFLAMPYVFRKKEQKWLQTFYQRICREFDGALIRNPDTLQWLRMQNYSGEIRSDYNVYAWNQKSKTVLQESGVDRFCAPCELNCRELASLGIERGTLIAYGHQPVMITANCIQKNTSGCLLQDAGKHKKERYRAEDIGDRTGEQSGTLLYLKDRYNKKFPVRNVCRYCYNVIYNCQPLVLLDQVREVEKLSPSEIRMDFLTESRDETERIIGLYHTCFIEKKPIKIPENMDYTRGHFKRGVK